MSLFIRQFIAITACSLFLVGCSPKDETNDPLFKKAQEALTNRQFENAKNLFQDYLKKNPQSWAAHRHLGGIYYDELNRPEYAIYHFEQCIILDQHHVEAAQLQSWCKEARKIYFEQLRREFAPNDATAKAEMENEIRRMKQTIADLRMQVRSNAVRNQPVTRGEPAPANEPTVGPSETERREAARRRLEARLASNSGGAGASSCNDIPEPIVDQPRNESNITRTAREHTVVAGDTLSKISRRYYSTTQKVNVLIESNPQLRGNANNLRVGMKIKIP